MKIGLIGCGNVGQFLLKTLNLDQSLANFRVEGLFDERENSSDKMNELAKVYGVKTFQDFSEFLQSDIDLVIEAANIHVVKRYALEILKNSIDIVLISIGALADHTFYQELESVSKAHGSKVYLPAGAIGGLDVLKAAMSLNQLESVTITTRKPPKALLDDSIDKETTVFQGSAGDAIAQFPKNINVAIILSLAGIGSRDTKVNIVADPSIDKNIHRIQASGTFGNLDVKIENYSMPGNPKTSYLTVLSILSILKDIDKTIKVG